MIDDLLSGGIDPLRNVLEHLKRTITSLVCSIDEVFEWDAAVAVIIWMSA